MTNPAPTINQINAFNATQGTTIDFNIIGGTELVRSNRIYIYDLSDNSLICTHLYVSTESIHELPANTDSSIVYESGKSSADFVNGAQYYAQIQTYTDTAGTQGGSGLSVAKMFWCLVDPTLTITTIPSTISTTSYNVSATYTDTSASVVSNIIQQYQFNLYSAVGSLLQSSGVVVGSGTQQGTSDSYDISYNFTGLNVGSSYYVTVEVTTTQGMSVDAQSGTFTVSIDTPTLGEATVVNNACDGYISVTSNLSSEYGGSGSGEIVSFETDSENVFTKLQVDLEPIQDLHGYDAPWVGGAGKNLFDIDNASQYASPSGVTPSSAYGEKVDNKLIVNYGLYSNRIYFDIPPIKLSANESFTISFDCLLPSGTTNNRLVWARLSDGTNVTSQDGVPTVFGTETHLSITLQASVAGEYNKLCIQPSGDENAYTNLNCQFTNIQIEKGSIATAWTPYSNICPISGHDDVEVDVVGKNLVDKNNITWTNAIRGDDGTPTASTSSHYTNAIYGVKANAEYTISGTLKTSTSSYRLYFLKKDGTWISRTTTHSGTPYTFTTPNECGAIQIQVAVTSTITLDDVQLEQGTTATSYEPYTAETIHPVSWQTEAGTVYGGTVDVVSGVLTVTHGYVDLGTLTWSYASGVFINYNSALDLHTKERGGNLVCSAYTKSGAVSAANMADGSIQMMGGASASNFWVKDSRFTDSTSFKNAVSGVFVAYELATPQTYQLTPQQIQTLVGQNNVWSEQGDVELSYHIPITNLLVKRQDVDDVSGNWLTLYSQPITQASDMDFTFIDFTNQYGKTYKYALVPLLTQTQSGVEVEVEGGYTVSDEVQSVFDGVFIADQTGLQKCKANVGYGNVDMNQAVGTITPIGAKYPVVITNSKNQYHNGSISGTIVPDDYYFNGNLSRIDMVNKRNELEQFLTNKRAKIIKDWNSNIWLVMIMDNISCSFNNNYGMGMVSFNANWVEVGDPTNQQDLQATGLINVGGV